MGDGCDLRLPATRSQSYCEITVWDELVSAMVLAVKNGTARGKLYVMATRTMFPGSFGPAVQAGGTDPAGVHHVTLTVIAAGLVSIPGKPRPVT